MTKKQFAIIFTLMALIVCVGVISSKLNSKGVTDPTDLGAFLSGESEEIQKTDSQSKNYFYEERIVKEEQDSVTTGGLEAVMADTNASQDKRDLASAELQEKIMKKDKEGRIELNVKSKGYEDVLCFIEGNIVRVVVKTEEKLTEEQTAAIQEIVEDVSAISEVVIEPKK